MRMKKGEPAFKPVGRPPVMTSHGKSTFARFVGESNIAGTSINRKDARFSMALFSRTGNVPSVSTCTPPPVINWLPARRILKEIKQTGLVKVRRSVPVEAVHKAACTHLVLKNHAEVYGTLSFISLLTPIASPPIIWGVPSTSSRTSSRGQFGRIPCREPTGGNQEE